MLLETEHEAGISVAAAVDRKIVPPSHSVAAKVSVVAKPRLASGELQRRVALANRISFVLCSLPVALLLMRFWIWNLGPNPVETITHTTGLWGIRLFWLTLAITPLRKLTGWCWLVRLRRIPALFSFFYVCLHLFTYLLFEQEFDAAGIWQDAVYRPYLAVGFACFVMLCPLAVTSTDRMMKRLGGRRWRQLHKLAYLAAIAAALHYLLLVKQDLSNPAVYIIILAGLFISRLGDGHVALPVWLRASRPHA